MNAGKDSTRVRILTAAEQLFVERGYHATTLQEIADRVGITKPALYYHFDAKADILANLLDPMTSELEHVLDQAFAAAETGGVAAAREVLIPGWLDVFLRSRGTLLALVRELASTPSGAFDRAIAAMERAIVLCAGPDAGVAEQVTMAQVVAAITDPVALMPHLRTDVLREHLLAGAWRLLGEPGDAPRPARRGGGRPRSLSAEDIALARELHASGEHSPESLAGRFGVSRATLYRHLKT
ncbi:TetR family transcriptional regulator [Actinophytocola gossypii]|uniref:TetR family transcriptional regulator n=1 Tax=Actinophytocola gossypii TaxID=2812003 RepID=A0ABT2JAJ0_9PSEU|nr:TetR family transcriptional regulator [Actinophytocola gossypii]MCT2584894.1 TetR family transcriptional regulator [Actinophytocola gossypii]